MSRQSKQEELTAALHSYLSIAEVHTPEEYPLDCRSVARALGVSPTTLYKYQLQKHISAAEQRQHERDKQTSKTPRCTISKERLQRLEETAKQAEERNKHLVARLALVEANSARLGIDPEELYRPVMKPIRTVSHAGKSGASASKRG
jgi:predicted RNase H-like nuclease (RuvC/YqgF family)